MLIPAHKKSKRTSRMSEVVQSVIANLLKKEVSDPRLLSVTITGVDLSPDLKNAIIFFSILDPTPENIKLVEKAFEKASRFFRFHLSRLTELRHTPKLLFRYDESLLIGERVSRLLSDENNQ